MQDLRVALVQSDPCWEDIDRNLELHEKLLENVESDVIVLPEMFTTGFTMNAEKLAEAPEGKTLRWMGEIAIEKTACVAGSFIVRENGSYFNRFYWINPFGNYRYFDKRHLFRMGGENRIYTAGDERQLVVWKGWSILPLICYDLRFPVWARNRSIDEQPEYDCLIYIASWPEKRRNHWMQLLQARAIENQSYLLGVNRVGTDGNNLNYSGDSCILQYDGVPLGSEYKKTAVLQSVLSKEKLQSYRQSFPAWKDGDEFSLQDLT